MNFLARYPRAPHFPRKEKSFHVRLRKFPIHSLMDGRIVKLSYLGRRQGEKGKESKKIQFVSQILRSRSVLCGGRGEAEGKNMEFSLGIPLE